MAEDTTAAHHRDERAREAGKLEALGRLASGVAHDFNNLLTGVILYSDLLLAGLEADERPSTATDQGYVARGQGANFQAIEGQTGDHLSGHPLSCSRPSADHASGDRLRQYAEEIRAAGVHASGLVRQLLAVARVPKGAAQPLSLNTVAEAMRQLLLRLIGEDIELVYQLDPKLGAVRMDFTNVQQILMNLVLNARDAMPEGGRITVETRNCGLQVVGGELRKKHPVELPCVLLVVGDNGQGMDAQTQQHVFDAFFTTKPAGEGTGLGLSTVCDIVTNNGGLIHIDSGLKRGTRVTVLLPLVPLPIHSFPQTSPAELSVVSGGALKPSDPRAPLLFAEEEPTP